MRRLHLLEIEDQPWCPLVIRDAITDLLEFFLRNGNYYAPAVPLLRAALDKTGQRDIVDLCSGGGGPWPRLVRDFGDGAPLRVVLTDKFPNERNSRRLAAVSQVHSETASVDATAVPEVLSGFRTMFTSFHHFRPEIGKRIIADAVRNRAGIGIFEFTERSLIGVISMAFTPLAVVLAVPFLRPVRWQNFVFTYLLPVIPLAALFDGVVSCFRTYAPRELEALVTEFQDDGYTWEVGQVRSWRSPLPITYLIGYPATDQLQPVSRRP